ncbi:MAG TPA: hypothetical protein VE136_08425 [Anaerolineales bacterium]|jgi:hypothetical protein|nr:hypothetical protein [Anaerolineales bacterium]
MTIPALVKPKIICNPFAFLLPPHPQSVRNPQVRSKDLGYEIGEDKLAGELCERPAGGLVDQTIPEIDPDEFEAVYRWFLS